MAPFLLSVSLISWRCRCSSTSLKRSKITLVCMMMKRSALLMAGIAVLVMAPAHSETLLMKYDEYMDRCLSTYGEDKVTKSVCESQYQAIEKKEQELMAQADNGEPKSWMPTSSYDELREESAFP